MVKKWKCSPLLPQLHLLGTDSRSFLFLGQSIDMVHFLGRQIYIQHIASQIAVPDSWILFCVLASSFVGSVHASDVRASQTFLPRGTLSSFDLKYEIRKILRKGRPSFSWITQYVDSLNNKNKKPILFQNDPRVPALKAQSDQRPVTLSFCFVLMGLTFFCLWSLSGWQENNAFQIGAKKRHSVEGNIFYWSMISESFYDMLGIKYDSKTFKGRFSGITKSWPVGMPLNTAGHLGAGISVCSQVSKFLGGVQRWSSSVSYLCFYLRAIVWHLIYFLILGALKCLSTQAYFPVFLQVKSFVLYLCPYVVERKSMPHVGPAS